MRLAANLFVAAAALLLLASCQEIRGPVWSLDGKRLAYTAYSVNATGIFDTALYILEADDETAEPQLIAKGAAFPCWATDNQTLYFAGERDAQGIYTKVYKQKIGAAPPEAAQAVLTGLRLTNFQMTADASLALLCTGQSARPGAPVSLDLWNSKDNKTTPLRQLGEVISPGLMPNGKAIAYAQKPAAALPLLYVCKLDGTQPEEVFPTQQDNEPNASTYIVHAFPDNDRFLFYSPGGANIWTIRQDGSNIRRYPLPENMSTPVMVAFDESTDQASVTLAQPAAEKILYHVFRLDFKNKRFTKLDGDSPELLGGHALDPRAVRRKGPPRYAWFSAGGLTVGEPGKAHYYPITSNQCVAATSSLIKQGESQKAVKIALKARELQPPPEDLSSLDRAEALAYLADKQHDLAATAFERSVLLFPVGPDGLKFVFPPNTGLPRPSPAELALMLREMDDLIKALPNNTLVPLLRQALDARSKGNQRQALDLYHKAIPMLPDIPRIGGLRFVEGLCAFEAGDLQAAAERWEAAAGCADFPHGAYAAGLSAIAFMLTERGDNVGKAMNMLNLAVARNSPIASELSQLVNELRGKSYVERTRSNESVSTDGTVRCWAEFETYRLPFASLNPTRVAAQDGKVPERRIGTRTVTASGIWLAGMQQPIFRIPAFVTVPVIAPNNSAVAFTAEGEVFPLRNTFCDVFVVDTRGSLLLGDPKAPFTGRVQSRYIVKDLRWTSAQELQATGSEVDVFGGETSFNRTLTVPSRAVLK